MQINGNLWQTFYRQEQLERAILFKQIPPRHTYYNRWKMQQAAPHSLKMQRSESGFMQLASILIKYVSPISSVTFLTTNTATLLRCSMLLHILLIF